MRIVEPVGSQYRVPVRARRRARTRIAPMGIGGGPPTVRLPLPPGKSQARTGARRPAIRRGLHVGGCQRAGGKQGVGVQHVGAIAQLTCVCLCIRSNAIAFVYAPVELIRIKYGVSGTAEG